MAWWMFVLAGYLLGSVPTGVLVGRVAGRDPRRGGSGNIGASNVTRTVGRAWGLVTLAVDVLKGLAPASAALRLAVDAEATTVAAAAAFAAVIGHCFPVWLRFRGGKGVATAFGGMAALAWPVAVVAALVWVGLVFITRVPALGSLAAAVLFVLLTGIYGEPFAVHLFAIATGLVLVVRHRSNLRALRLRRRY